MSVNFYMVELVVSRFDLSRMWYADLLGMKIERLDPANQFVLFTTDTGNRLALKAGEPLPSSVRLHFEVPDLNECITKLKNANIALVAEIKESSEGYRRVVVADPDGYRIVLFEWTTKPGSANRC